MEKFLYLGMIIQAFAAADVLRENYFVDAHCRFNFETISWWEVQYE